MLALLVSVEFQFERYSLFIGSLKFLISWVQSFSRWFEQVSDEGDVLYVFPKDYRSKLATKSFRIKLEPFVEKAKVLISHYVSCWNSKCKFIKVLTKMWCYQSLTVSSWVFSKSFLWDSTNCFNCSCLYDNYCTPLK